MDCAGATDLHYAERLPGLRDCSIGINHIATTTFGYDVVTIDTLNMHQIAIVESAAIQVCESKRFPGADRRTVGIDNVTATTFSYDIVAADTLKRGRVGTVAGATARAETRCAIERVANHIARLRSE